MNSDSDPQHYALVLSNSDLTIDKVSDSYVADDSLRKKIREAQIVLVPSYVNTKEGRILAFPDGTEQLFHYLQEKFNRSLVGAAISDEDYVELALHHDEIRLADILLVSKDWLPAIVEALTAFIEARAGMLPRGATVESELHYKESTGKLISLKYKGPVDSFERALETLFSDQDASGTDVEAIADEN